MALNTEPVVTEFRADTTGLERGMSRAEESFGRSSQKMARDVLGLGRSVDSFTRSGGNMSDKVGGLVFDLSQLAESSSKLGSRWGSMLAIVGQAAPWIAIGASITTATMALDELMGRPVGRWTEDLADALFKLQAPPTSGPTRAMLEENIPITFGGVPMEKASADLEKRMAKRVTRGARRAATPTPEESDVFEKSWIKMLDERAQDSAFRRDQEIAAYDEQQATMRERFAESQRQLIEENRAILEAEGIDPDSGVAGMFLGSQGGVARKIDENELQMLRLKKSMEEVGRAAKTVASAGFQSFIATLSAGKGMGAAFQAMINSMLQSLAGWAAGKTIEQLAEGWEALGSLNPLKRATAPAHFKAAALYAALATTTGIMAGAAGGGGGAGAGGGGDFAGGFTEGTGQARAREEPQPIIIKVEVPPGGQAAAGQGVIDAIEAYERERGRRQFARG